MAIVCPAVLADSEENYHKEMEKIAGLAQRIQIDLTDGEFAKSPTVKPEQAWWPVGIKADYHLMYNNPLPAAKIVLEHKPNMIIVHAEAEGDFNEVVDFCRNLDVLVGVALLAKTPVETILPALDKIDHVLIFSGDLGHYGGQADLGLLDKVQKLKAQKPNLEIGWDGGVSDQNVSQLVAGGVDVLNVGGYIQKSDNPQKAFQTLKRIADETGTA
jgi:pentose-5-phosphate-3-epimerase